MRLVHEVYTQLAKRHLVEMAVGEFRRAYADRKTLGSSRPDWGVPVVYAARGQRPPFDLLNLLTKPPDPIDLARLSGLLRQLLEELRLARSSGRNVMRSVAQMAQEWQSAAAFAP